MIKDFSYGIIPLRKKNQGWEVLLVLSCHGKYWGFPKGHAIEEENPKIAAQRELKEETNLEVKTFFDEKFIEEYEFYKDRKKIQKKVIYFLAEVEGEIMLQKDEILNSSWVDIDEAKKILTYPQSQSFAQSVAKILKKS